MNPNEPAYPNAELPGIYPAMPGLTKRELLAAMVRLSLFDENLITLFKHDSNTVEETIVYAAKLRVRAADALLAELSATEFCKWKRITDDASEPKCQPGIVYDKVHKFCPYCSKPIQVKEAQ